MRKQQDHRFQSCGVSPPGTQVLDTTATLSRHPGTFLYTSRQNRLQPYSGTVCTRRRKGRYYRSSIRDKGREAWPASHEVSLSSSACWPLASSYWLAMRRSDITMVKNHVQITGTSRSWRTDRVKMNTCAMSGFAISRTSPHDMDTGCGDSESEKG